MELAVEVERPCSQEEYHGGVGDGDDQTKKQRMTNSASRGHEIGAHDGLPMARFQGVERSQSERNQKNAQESCTEIHDYLKKRSKASERSFRALAGCFFPVAMQAARWSFR